MTKEITRYYQALAATFKCEKVRATLPPLKYVKHVPSTDADFNTIARLEIEFLLDLHTQ